MSRSMKILLWILVAVVVLGAGVWLYVTKYGNIGADTVGDSISIVDTYPKPNNYTMNCSAAPKNNCFIQVLYSSSVKGQINSINLSEYTNNNLIPVTQFTPSYPDKYKGKMLEVNINAPLKPGTFYNLSASSSNNSSIQSAAITFVTKNSAKPTMSDIGYTTNTPEIYTDTAGLLTISVLDSTNKTLTKETKLQPKGPVWTWADKPAGRLNTLTFFPYTNTHPWIATSLVSQYNSGSYKLVFSMVNNAGKATSITKEFVYIKPIKVLIGKTNTAGTYQLTSQTPLTKLDGTPLALARVRLSIDPLRVDTPSCDAGGFFTTTDPTGKLNLTVKDPNAAGSEGFTISGYYNLSDLGDNYRDYGETQVFETDGYLK